MIWHQYRLKIQGHYHILIVVLMCLRKGAVADEASKDGDTSDINAMQGRSLLLTSEVDFSERCYFVFTPESGRVSKSLQSESLESSSYQCCYNMPGSDDDCEEYERRGDDLKCLKENVDYVMKLDSEELERPGTCNLTIKSVSENSAGRYKSFEADHTALRVFRVKVAGSPVVLEESPDALETLPYTWIAVGLAVIIISVGVVIGLSKSIKPGQEAGSKILEILGRRYIVREGNKWTWRRDKRPEVQESVTLYVA